MLGRQTDDESYCYQTLKMGGHKQTFACIVVKQISSLPVNVSLPVQQTDLMKIWHSLDSSTFCLKFISILNISLL